MYVYQLFKIIKQIQQERENIKGSKGEVIKKGDLKDKTNMFLKYANMETGKKGKKYGNE